MINTFWLKAAGIGAALLALAVLVLDRNHQRSLARDRGEKLEMICTAVRDAAGNPKLACKDVVRQIGELSDSIGRLKAGIAEQNKAVKDLADTSASQQDEAKKAISRNAERAKAAEATADRLRTSAARNSGKNGPCEPSDELKGAWR